MRHTLLVLLIVVAASAAQAQGFQRLHISNDDPRWGDTITVSYFAPAESQADTIYCSTEFRGDLYEPALVQPMRQIGRGNFEATVSIPAKTSTVWLEIVTPRDRMPDGISVFTCRTSDGLPAPGALLNAVDNVDSALAVEWMRYPTRYTVLVRAYDRLREEEMQGIVRKSNEEWQRIATTLYDSLLAHRDTSLSWYLTAYGLDSRLHRDSEARHYLNKAASVVTFDPVLNDVDFWNHFFAPVFSGGHLRVNIEPGRILSPLAAHFPNTRFATRWLSGECYDSALSGSLYSKLADRRRASHDVDLLQAIADAYRQPALMNVDSQLYWLAKAEESARDCSGFFSGENIYGSMGRLNGIITRKITVLGAKGRIREAEAAADLILGSSMTDEDAKRTAAINIANVYLNAGQLAKAEQAFSNALAISTSSDVQGFDKLFAIAKHEGETNEQFRERLTKEYLPSIGLRSIPDFDYVTLDGKRGRLSELRGKVILLDCWFISCAGCLNEKASLNELAQSYAKDTNIVFLSIALDDQKALRSYQARTPFAFQIVPNGKAICERLGVSGYPTHILIAKNGATLGIEEGGDKNEGDLLRPKLERALAE